MEEINSLKEEFLDQTEKLLFSEFSKKEEIKGYLRERVKNNEAFVVIENNKVLGIICYLKKYSHDYDYIDFVVVAKEGRGKGIATRLINKIIEISKKRKFNGPAYLLSSTAIDNEISIKMHEKLGFEVLGILKKLHYGKEEIFFGYELN